MQLRLTKAVRAIAIICFVAFIVQQGADRLFGTNLLRLFAVVPADLVMEYRVWQLITYAFLHGDVMHLFLNLMMLVFIGSEIEAAWGTKRFLKFYFFCSISAALFYLFLQIFLAGTSLHVPMIGASGAIYGLLMAYGLLFGDRVLLFMMLFPMKARHFIWVLAAVEFMSTVFSSRTGVASAAHLGGMAAGWAYLWGWGKYIQYRNRRGGGGGPRPPRKKRSAEHLKLVVNRDPEQHMGPLGSGDHDENPKIWH